MSLEVFKKYKGEWEIKTPPNPTKFKSIVSPPFSPLPDYDIKFCFEAWYQRMWDDISHLYLFKLKLVKLNGACVSPTLEVSVDVMVNYADGSLFKEYPNWSSRNIHGMEDVIFDDVVRNEKDKNGKWDYSHYNKMASNTLIIKCIMTFSGLEQSLSEINIKSGEHADFVENLKSVYEPTMLSDFALQVGDRSFPAHKVILAAHSPVFMKMMSQECLESKTSTVTDATPEIFDTFLESLYSGEIGDKSLDSLKELYRLTDIYDVKFLKKKCTSLIISFLSVDSVCEILVWAYSFPDSDVRSAVKSYAFNHIKEIASRDDWKELVNTQPMIGYEVLANFIPK